MNVPLPLMFLRYIHIHKTAECARMCPNVPECALALGLNVPLPAVIESAENPFCNAYVVCRDATS